MQLFCSTHNIKLSLLSTLIFSCCLQAAVIKTNPLVAPYKDISINLNWNTGIISTEITGVNKPFLDVIPKKSGAAIVLAFATGQCGQETWGSALLDSKIEENLKQFNQQQQPYIISTGGARGVFSCDANNTQAFKAFVDRYKTSSLIGFDFDIEDENSAENVVSGLIAGISALVQDPNYQHLRFSFTIPAFGGIPPAGTDGLGNIGHIVLSNIYGNESKKIPRSAIADSVIINLMTMDYGSATEGNCIVGVNPVSPKPYCDMGASAIQAALNLHQQHNIPFAQIAVTPMIGRNDTSNSQHDEIFSLSDADVMLKFAREHQLAGVHFWSWDRDSYCDVSYVSATCSSYEYNNPQPLDFFHHFINPGQSLNLSH